MNAFFKLGKYALTFSLLFQAVFSMGQSSQLSGKIIDENKEPLIGVVTELRNSKDSSLAKVAVVDNKGQFAFENIKAGNYYIKASLLGFAPYNSSDISLDGTSPKSLPDIKLSASTVALKEANVSAIKPLIEVHPDKTVFNVENSINSTGNNVMELLQKAPGVVVDNNNNINLKGRSGVLVQIDGRDPHLTQDELAEYLKSIQSVDVEAIEIISNPSSKYDASGTAGIINIKLKKNKNYGTNGSLTLGYALGHYSKYNTAISLNNRSKNYNVFGNYSNNWGERQNEFNLYREQNPYIFESATLFNRWGLNQNYKAGIDYTLDKKNTIGMMVNGNYSNIEGTNNTNNNIHDFDTYTIDSILKSNQTVDGHTNNINLNLNQHFADTSGHELTSDFDFGFYDGARDNFQPNVYTLPDNETVLSETNNRSESDTRINIYTFKSDYSQNFLKGKLGAGYKLSFVKTDNNYNFYNIVGNVETLDLTRSNHFIYTENVYAGYLNYQRTIKKFDIQAGLRMENTSSEGDLKSASDTVLNSNVKRNYLDFFPSGGITYNMNQDNSFSMIYSRRIDRPNYQELNPFVFKLDELSFRVGNPFLNPQYSDKYEISHTYKYATTTSIGYSHTTDFFAQITDTIPGGKSFLTSKNLATEDIFSIDLSSSVQPFKWYGIYFHIGLYRQDYDADFGEGKTINTSVTNLNLYAQNTFKLPLDLTFEVSGWYNSAGVWGGAYVTEPQGSLDLGLQKKFFSNQATLKLSYTDILHTAPWDSHNVYAGIVIKANGDWESQQFRASFTWRFGNSQMKGVRQHTGGNESETKRVQGGDQ